MTNKDFIITVRGAVPGDITKRVSEFQVAALKLIGHKKAAR